MPLFSIIVAFDEQQNIGNNGTLPFKISKDMKYFREKTTGSVVIMGRLTWVSIGSKPLKGRVNIVISKKLESGNDYYVVDSFESALKLAESFERSIYVIGGGQIYNLAINHPDCYILYVTRIYNTYENCDVKFPLIPNEFNLVSNINDFIEYENGIGFRFEVWKK